MGKEALFLALLIVLITSFSLISADGNVTKAYNCLIDKVDGSKCSSSSISLEDKIFSLLSVKECKSQVLGASKNKECWPKSSCNIKNTAQAILALDHIGVDTSDAEDWLLEQKMIPSDLLWYLQIDSDEETSCTITFNSGTYGITIDEDKKLTSASGQCFEKASGDYWLKISSSCYEKEFDISCDKSFLTNLIYQEQGSDLFFISEKTSSASANGFTSEKIESYCLKEGSVCSYEGSLWAALALAYVGEYAEADTFVPYLMTMAETNEKYLPEAFLYYLTDYSEYKYQLLEKQKFNKYWQVIPSNDKYYDSAVALFPFADEELQEKTKTKNWLLSVQESNGCWGNSIRDTAFILYSVWPEEAPFGSWCDDKSDCDEGEFCSDDNECVNCLENDDCNNGEICVNGYCIGDLESCDDDSECDDGFCVDDYCVECEEDSNCGTNEKCEDNFCVEIGDECDYDSECETDEECDDGVCVEKPLPDCEDEEYFCRSTGDCIGDGGSVLEGYFCLGPKKCCSVSEEEETCSQLNGIICDSDQNCAGGTETDADDLNYGEMCCVGGACEDQASILSDCAYSGGVCRSSCYDDEEISYDECTDSSDSCCILGQTEKKSYFWIWVFGILIVLVLILILFRNKLRVFGLKFKSMFGRPSQLPRRPGFPPPSTGTAMMRPQIQRRILPPQHPSPRPPQQFQQRPKSDLDDVLRKLKEIGK